MGEKELPVPNHRLVIQQRRGLPIRYLKDFGIPGKFHSYPCTTDTWWLSYTYVSRSWALGSGRGIARSCCFYREKTPEYWIEIITLWLMNTIRTLYLFGVIYATIIYYWSIQLCSFRRWFVFCFFGFRAWRCRWKGRWYWLCGYIHQSSCIVNLVAKKSSIQTYHPS